MLVTRQGLSWLLALTSLWLLLAPVVIVQAWQSHNNWQQPSYQPQQRRFVDPRNNDNDALLLLLLQQVFDYTNMERIRHNVLPELRYNTELAKAAQYHAQDMAQHDYLSHTGLVNGSDLVQRVLIHTAYRYQHVGENLYCQWLRRLNRTRWCKDGWPVRDMHRIYSIHNSKTLG